MSEHAGLEDRAHAPSGRLAELLACERELAERLRATREEAARRIEEATSAAQRAEAELEASLEAEARGVRGFVRTRSQARMREIAAGARARVARLDGAVDAEVARLAEEAFRHLVAGGDSR